MNRVNQIINDSYKNIDNNKSLNIDNSIDKSKYALKESFIPRTKESSAAKEIASKFEDLKNFALYYSLVNRIGPDKAYQLLQETLDDIKRGEKNGRPIRNPGALFNWKAQTYLKTRIFNQI